MTRSGPSARTARVATSEESTPPERAITARSRPAFSSRSRMKASIASASALGRRSFNETRIGL